ncbi:hypothetical protein SKAU_G00409610 [Synaphobranchus kaupii]|uniref:Uncharacterized protein n=1 Tax=Synaphobranchus kaupii TaxID=118154 RepID=A0A9Q1EAN2_SYNKA|nr:hypothetical protein SKAU_G00409610 [Synaphobranchus kaupii]
MVQTKTKSDGDVLADGTAGPTTAGRAETESTGEGLAAKPNKVWQTRLEPTGAKSALIQDAATLSTAADKVRGEPATAGIAVGGSTLAEAGNLDAKFKDPGCKQDRATPTPVTGALHAHPHAHTVPAQAGVQTQREPLCNSAGVQTAAILDWSQRPEQINRSQQTLRHFPPLWV